MPGLNLYSTWFKSTLPNKSEIVISSVYRSRNADLTKFNLNLEGLLDPAFTKEKKMTIVTIQAVARVVFYFYLLTQLIKHFTRIRPNSSTLIGLAPKNIRFWCYSLSLWRSPFDWRKFPRAKLKPPNFVVLKTTVSRILLRMCILLLEMLLTPNSLLRKRVLHSGIH